MNDPLLDWLYNDPTIQSFCGSNIQYYKDLQEKNLDRLPGLIIRDLFYYEFEYYVSGVQASQDGTLVVEIHNWLSDFKNTQVIREAVVARMQAYTGFASVVLSDMTYESHLIVDDKLLNILLFFDISKCE